MPTGGTNTDNMKDAPLSAYTPHVIHVHADRLWGQGRLGAFARLRLHNISKEQ